MLRPKEELARLAKRFICVRVTNMTTVDIARYRFDFDLTFSALIAHADGTVLHRFGTRDESDPEVWISMPAFLRFLRLGLVSHSRHQGNRRERARPQTIGDLESWQSRVAGRKIDCVHCHNVGEAERAEEQAKGGWSRERIWIWPEPSKVGLELDPVDQTLVRKVHAKSPAERAGLEVGDRLLRAQGQRLISIADLQAQLEALSFGSDRLLLAYSRGDENEEREASLRLEKGWRRGTPETFAWRASMWMLSPAPGFGGAMLDAAAQSSHGVAGGPHPFAMRIDYIVDWGHRAFTGRNVKKAGLRRGDVVLAVGREEGLREPRAFPRLVSAESESGGEGRDSHRSLGQAAASEASRPRRIERRIQSTA